jgi:hypothetical protein
MAEIPRPAVPQQRKAGSGTSAPDSVTRRLTGGKIPDQVLAQLEAQWAAARVAPTEESSVLGVFAPVLGRPSLVATLGGALVLAGLLVTMALLGLLV